jgi:hypothetical protein
MQGIFKLPIKAYLSDLFSPLPISWQETVLAAHVPGWPSEVAIFRDVLSRSERRRQSPEALVDRGEMLRPTKRQDSDTIYLASLTVIAWDENDFRNIMHEITSRGSVVVAVDDDQRIDRSVPLDTVVQTWKRARKKKRIANAQLKGGKISAERKKAKAAEGVERIRPYWGMPAHEWPTLKLRQMAGTIDQPMAYNTIVAHIGYGRELAHKRYLAALRRKVTLAEKEMA